MTSGTAPTAGLSQENWDATFEDLVPLSTQLVPPALAEAFEIPTAKASVPISQLGQLAKPSASGQTKSSYQAQIYPVRPNSVAVTQTLGQGYFPQTAHSRGQQQPASAIKTPTPLQQHPGLVQDIPGLGPSSLQQAAYHGDDPGPPGYISSGGQLPSWHDQANGGQVQPPQPSARAQQDASYDDAELECELQTRALKRPRLVWTAQLHQRFVDAVKQLGLKNAVPKTIMQLMNVDGLTRENVASHLQKYRLQLRKEEGRGEGVDSFEEEHYRDVDGYE